MLNPRYVVTLVTTYLHGVPSQVSLFTGLAIEKQNTIPCGLLPKWLGISPYKWGILFHLRIWQAEVTADVTFFSPSSCVIVSFSSGSAGSCFSSALPEAPSDWLRFWHFAFCIFWELAMAPSSSNYFISLSKSLLRTMEWFQFDSSTTLLFSSRFFSLLSSLAKSLICPWLIYGTSESNVFRCP